MRKLLTNLCAMSLVVWYSLSVIGFDVHTCNRAGETFIASAGEYSCETIHPEHEYSCCHHGHDHHDAETLHTSSFEIPPCCTDDYHVISLTGIRSEDEHAKQLRQDIAGDYIANLPYEEDVHFNIFQSGLRVIREQASVLSRHRSLHEFYNIWRV